MVYTPTHTQTDTQTETHNDEFINLDIDWIMPNVELFRAISMFKFQVDLHIIELSSTRQTETDTQTHTNTHKHTHTHTHRHVGI